MEKQFFAYFDWFKCLWCVLISLDGIAWEKAWIESEYMGHVISLLKEFGFRELDKLIDP